MASETVVVGLNWVGDNVLALPTYRALHHRFRAEPGLEDDEADQQRAAADQRRPRRRIRGQDRCDAAKVRGCATN